MKSKISGVYIFTMDSVTYTRCPYTKLKLQNLPAKFLVLFERIEEKFFCMLKRKTIRKKKTMIMPSTAISGLLVRCHQYSFLCIGTASAAIS